MKKINILGGLIITYTTELNYRLPTVSHNVELPYHFHTFFPGTFVFPFVLHNNTRLIPKVRSPKRWVLLRAAVGNPVEFVASPTPPTTTKHART
jgi:hypothetical protein